jgi:hypothetical protein
VSRAHTAEDPLADGAVDTKDVGEAAIKRGDGGNG